MPIKSLPLFVASHGGPHDNEPLNDLSNALGAGVQRLQVSDAGKTITVPQIRGALVEGVVFVIIGLCEQSLVPSSMVRAAERNLLRIAGEKNLRYGIFCRRIAYPLSHHLFDEGDNCAMILTCEKPSEQQAITLRRAYPNAGVPIQIHIPQTDAARVAARMVEVLSLAA
jgi:hypothetical protein